MIEILILYILNRYDATIYKIAKIIETSFFAFAKPSFGTINPALKRLESLGCIEFISKITSGGKQSKLYSITSFGKKYLKSLMTDAPLESASKFLNNVNILLFCSDIFEENERIAFLKRLSDYLSIYKADIEKKLFDPYEDFSEFQKTILKNAYNQADALSALVQKC